MRYRESFTSVVIARSSDSRTERPSPFSSSARTPVALHGLFCSEDSTRRVSLRYDTSRRSGGRANVGNEAWAEWRTDIIYRKSPRSAPAAQSRASVPSLVLPSTLSRRDDPSDQRPVPLPAQLPSRRARRSELLLRARRRLRRQRPPPVLQRATRGSPASREQRVHQ